MRKRKPINLPRRNAAQASGDPLREVKIELGVVLLAVVAIYALTLRLAMPAWKEALIVLVSALLGALWIIGRTWCLVRRQESGFTDHGEL